MVASYTMNGLNKAVVVTTNSPPSSTTAHTTSSSLNPLRPLGALGGQRGTGEGNDFSNGLLQGRTSRFTQNKNNVHRNTTMVDNSTLRKPSHCRWGPPAGEPSLPLASVPSPIPPHSFVPSTSTTTTSKPLTHHRFETSSPTKPPSPTRGPDVARVAMVAKRFLKLAEPGGVKPLHEGSEIDRTLLSVADEETIGVGLSQGWRSICKFDLSEMTWVRAIRISGVMLHCLALPKVKHAFLEKTSPTEMTRSQDTLIQWKNAFSQAETQVLRLFEIFSLHTTSSSGKKGTTSLLDDLVEQEPETANQIATSFLITQSHIEKTNPPADLLGNNRTASTVDNSNGYGRNHNPTQIHHNSDSSNNKHDPKETPSPNEAMGSGSVNLLD